MSASRIPAPNVIVASGEAVLLYAWPAKLETSIQATRRPLTRCIRTLMMGNRDSPVVVYRNGRLSQADAKWEEFTSVKRHFRTGHRIEAERVPSQNPPIQ